jgi:hypothetical protein
LVGDSNETATSFYNTNFATDYDAQTLRHRHNSLLALFDSLKSQAEKNYSLI